MQQIESNHWIKIIPCYLWNTQRKTNHWQTLSHDRVPVATSDNWKPIAHNTIQQIESNHWIKIIPCYL
jgi:hypothetical protein